MPPCINLLFYSSNSSMALTMFSSTLLPLLFLLFISPSTASRSAAAIKGGYWPSWLAETNPPSTIQTSYFSHFFYAFVVPNSNTNELSITAHDNEWMRNFTTTLHKKKPWAKALLSIGGGASNSSAFAAIAANPSLRATFIASTINVARNYGFDGLDLDWEFPATQQDMSNLATLFAEWRTAVNKESVTNSRPRRPRLLLSAAVYFASNFFLSSTPRAFPAESINKNLDFVNVMCYDYHGSWDTSATGAHALLYDRTSNISTSYGVGSWISAGVGPGKVVMGLPLYGRTWQLKDPAVHGIGAPAVGVGPGPGGVLTFREIVDFNGRNKATTVYDADTISTYSFAGNAWIGYDGVWSVRRKVQYAKAHGLGGYFFWALGYDKDWTLSKTASIAWNS